MRCCVPLVVPSQGNQIWTSKLHLIIASSATLPQCHRIYYSKHALSQAEQTSPLCFIFYLRISSCPPVYYRACLRVWCTTDPMTLSTTWRAVWRKWGSLEEQRRCDGIPLWVRRRSLFPLSMAASHAGPSSEMVRSDTVHFTSTGQAAVTINQLFKLCFMQESDNFVNININICCFGLSYDSIFSFFRMRAVIKVKTKHLKDIILSSRNLVWNCILLRHVFLHNFSYQG